MFNFYKFYSHIYLLNFYIFVYNIYILKVRVIKSFKKIKLIIKSYMMVNFNRDFQILLTALQLTFFALLGSLSIYKMILSKKNNANFLQIFYLFSLLVISVYVAMMTYQIVRLTFDLEIHLVVLIITNVYSMIFQAVLLFLLSFYWKQTEAMLRGSALDSQQSVSNIKKQMKFKGVCLGLWFLFYTGFVTYAIINQMYLNNSIYQDIFYFGGQGFSTLILAWSNISQIISAKYFSFTLKRYQSLVSYQMNKGKFRCIYWAASTINFIRLVYLITAMIIFRIYPESQKQKWLAIFIYTASALIPLAIYLYSFQINSKNKIQRLQSFSGQTHNLSKQANLFYEPPQIGSSDRQNKSKLNRVSFNETQLSSSYESHGI